jgi:hypothetical protein
MSNHLPALLDTVLVFLIITFLILFMWSRIMHQRVIDTLNEIKEFVTGFGGGGIEARPEVIAR